MDFFSSMHASATGLAAGRTQMNIVSANLANSATTRTPGGGPYQRKFMVLASQPVDEYKAISAGDEPVQGVRVAEIVADTSPFPMAHIPGHPDADANGDVRLPNVNVITEMASMLLAKKAYDANAAALNAAKSMALKALEIGR